MNKATVNSGVCITGTCCDYYGKLTEIVEVEYPSLPIKRVVLFKCEWFDPTENIGFRIHDGYRLVDVNKRRRFNKFEPFILAMQATQVCYISYPSLRRDRTDWLAVCRVKPRGWLDQSSKNVDMAVDRNVPYQENEGEAIRMDSLSGFDDTLDLTNESLEFFDVLDNDSSDSSDEPILLLESSTEEEEEEEEEDDDDQFNGDTN